ncbi:MAG TPA: hypothetical protein VMH77_03950 [Steroidobacteraceae bacterium]|nr:hypothetical protein [Steroidobacteraceae bacterium]
MNQALRAVACAARAAACVLWAGAAFGADACGEYKWDVSNEVRLFATAPTPLDAAATVQAAPSIATGTLYALTLQPQEAIRYAAPPGKKQLADGAYGGLLRLKVARAGAYRVAIDAAFWLDVVSDGRSLPALDFNGQRQCAGPHKIVVYDLPAGVELTLQVAAASEDTARLTVTPVAAPGT